jgi:hypothetical protein
VSWTRVLHKLFKETNLTIASENDLKCIIVVYFDIEPNAFHFWYITLTAQLHWVDATIVPSAISDKWPLKKQSIVKRTTTSAFRGVELNSARIIMGPNYL